MIKQHDTIVLLFHWNMYITKYFADCIPLTCKTIDTIMKSNYIYEI